MRFLQNASFTTLKGKGRWTAGLGIAAAGLLALSAESHGTGELSSYAHVRDDATLEVSGRHIRLYGIYMPDTGQACETRLRPVRCGTRAAGALRFKIRGFVTCTLGVRYSDGSYAGYCRNGDDDLGTYLIDRGWALATPSAPFAYHAHERVARHRGFGIWGFPVDSVVLSR